MKTAEEERLRKLQRATAVKQDKERYSKKRADDESQYFDRLKGTYTKEKNLKAQQAELNNQMLR